MRKLFAILMVLAVGLLLLTMLSCDRQISEPYTPPGGGGNPEAPGNLSADIGDRQVELTWTVTNREALSGFRVYMSDSTANRYRIVSEVVQTQYTATGLQNAVSYYFKVSSVNLNGFEGSTTEPIMAIPNFYAITINNGDAYTNNRNVTLTLIAPNTTQFMQISSDSLFVGAQWEDFVASRNWRLSLGDGTKTVYAKFRDSTDRNSMGISSDAILLDTEAFIDSLVFSPYNVPFAPGDVVHFKLYAEEPEGRASVTVGQGLIQANLNDDGSRGDQVAGDGIYELDYIVANTLDFENADVFGNFTDRAGNNAQRVQALHNMSVRQPPDPTSIISVVAPGRYFDRLILTWTQSNALDFGQYRVYRSSNPGVDSTDILVDVITQISMTTLTDSSLVQNVRYYYKIFVVDNTNLWSGSNEASGLTNRNLPPDPLVLYPIVPVPGERGKLQINWSASNDLDFLRYELYRSLDNNVDTTDVLAFVSSTQLSCIDSNLAADTVYYYRVLARDRAGNWSWSNTQSGHTLPLNLGWIPSPLSRKRAEVELVQAQGVIQRRFVYAEAAVSDICKFMSHDFNAAGVQPI